MTPHDFEERLRELANRVDAPELDATLLVRRGTRIRRRRLAAGLTACLALVALAAASVTLWPGSARQAVTAAGRTTTTLPSMGASALAAGTWSELPSAPLSPRIQPTVTWTGDEMIVWGGEPSQGGTPLNDGAAYDPRSQRWRPLPDSPLSPRYAVSAVWTGTELVIWGGSTSAGNHDAAKDGAAFNPSTGKWHSLSASPLSARGSARAVWTGGQVVIVGGVSPNGPSTQIDGASYDPAVDRWVMLPTPPITGHQSDHLEAVWAGDRVLVADLWATRQQVDTNTFAADAGVDFFTLRPNDSAWSAIPKSDDAPQGLNGLIWTGSSVLAPACDVWRGFARGPGPSVAPGRKLDLRSGSWTSIAAGPVEDGYGTTVWTGSALVHVASSSAEGPRTINPGDTEIWDPSSDTWARAASAPEKMTTGTGVWTGHEVLIWADVYDTTAKEVAVRFGPSAAAPSTTEATAPTTSEPGGEPASSSTEGTTTTTTEGTSSTSEPDAAPPGPSPCADTVPAITASQRNGSDQMVVPDSPVSVIGCRYHGFNQPQPNGSLAASAQMDSAQLAQLANASQRVEPGAVYHCPEDAGERYFLRFTYNDGPDLLVRIDVRGCHGLTNGDIQAFASEDLMNQLHAALGADPT